MIKIFGLETPGEPDYQKFETGLEDGIGCLYVTRALADEAAGEYNAAFQDEEPASVFEVRLEGIPPVIEQELLKVQEAGRQAQAS